MSVRLRNPYLRVGLGFGTLGLVVMVILLVAGDGNRVGLGGAVAAFGGFVLSSPWARRWDDRHGIGTDKRS